MKLTEKRIAQLSPGRHSDGDGLYLEVTSPTNRCWLLRWQRDGRERWMGLGSLKLFSLKEARERAKKARQLIHDGIDPLEARAVQRDAERKTAAERLTFKEAAERFYALHESGWRNKKHRTQWLRTVEKFAYPELGPRPVKAIDTAVINAALAPIWTRVPATASRTRDRVERVLKWVQDGMPLPVASAVAGSKGHAALPYSEIPAFMTKLRARADIAALALEFAILTAARSGEALGARWVEIDQTTKMWTVPGARMKAGREHRVPFPIALWKSFAAVPREHNNPFCLLVRCRGKSLGENTLSQTMKRLHSHLIRRMVSVAPSKIGPAR